MVGKYTALLVQYKYTAQSDGEMCQVLSKYALCVSPWCIAVSCKSADSKERPIKVFWLMCAEADIYFDICHMLLLDTDTLQCPILSNTDVTIA